MGLDSSCKDAQERVSTDGESLISGKIKRQKKIRYFLLFAEGYDSHGKHFLNLLHTTRRFNVADVIDEIEISYNLTNVQINGYNEISRREVEIWLEKKKK